MSVKLSHFIFAAMVVGPPLAASACSSDTETPPNAAVLPDAGSPSEASQNEGSLGLSIPDGLVIDGIVCTGVSSPYVPATWPSWSSFTSGTCGDLGDVSVSMSSLGTIPYPQACSASTTVRLTMPNIVAKGGPFNANGAVGSCTIVEGAAVDGPSSGVALIATLVGDANPTILHHISFRAAAPDCSVPHLVDRPSAVACRATRPPGDAQAHTGDECTSDAECTTGTNGRCSATVDADGTNAHRTCTYDACQQDSDCAHGVCGCNAGFGGQNLCLSNSDCHVNADCPTGRCVLSSPYFSPTGISQGDELTPRGVNRGEPEAVGYFCTTPNDNCCSLGSGQCDYSWTDKRWAWGYGP